MIKMFGKRCGKSVQCYEDLLKTLQNKDVTSVVLYSKDGETIMYSQQYVDNLEAKIKKAEAVEEYNYNNYQNVMNRVAKAIEYIEKYKEPLHHSFDEPDCDYWIATNPDDLLNILRGEDNE